MTNVTQNVSIRVRILVSWHQPPYGNIPETQEFVFMDENADKIQASIRTKFYDAFKQLLSKGSTIIVDGFSVAVNPSKYVVIQNRYKVLILNSTKINAITDFQGPEKLGERVLQAKIISGSNIGDTIFIPRMRLSPSDKRLPFKFQRRQFPLSVCFAMTINKSQGQILSHVGLFLKKPVFSHGQLYVALSRVKSKKGLKVMICDDDGKANNKTTNVFFKEVLGNL